MDEQAVRTHAQAHVDALIAGDVDRAIQDFSRELRMNLGEIMAILPLPLISGEIEAVDKTGTGYKATLHLVGETTETRIETRWKERDGNPTIVEASHLTTAEVPAAEAVEPAEGQAEI